MDKIEVSRIAPDDTRRAGWWTSEDGQGQYDMTGDTLAQAKETLLGQCSDDAQRAGILAGTLQVLGEDPRTEGERNPA